MQLVIAEKPSVAESLSRILGVSTRHDGYMEGKKYIVSWCFGHLAGLADADVYDSRYAKWKMEDLPIIPSTFQFRVAEGKQNQFDVLQMLMRREDVTEVINACDAGREGELIFRTVYHLAGCSSVPALILTGCTKVPSAVPKRTGWWASTPPDIFLSCTAQS